MGGFKRTLLCPERKPFMGLFAMSHWGEEGEIGQKRKRESESEKERLIRSHCTFVVSISNVKYFY